MARQIGDLPHVLGESKALAQLVQHILAQRKVESSSLSERAR